jgi:hypothetical protein
MPDDPAHHALVRDLRAGLLARAAAERDSGRSRRARGAAGPGQGGRGRRRRTPPRRPASASRRRGCLIALVSVLAVGALLVALADGRPAAAPDAAPGPVAAESGPQRSHRPAAPVTAQAWAGVVADLDRRRATALTAHDAVGLRALHLPRTASLRADLRALRALRAEGLRPDGLRSVVVRVQPLGRSSPGRVRLRVVDRRPAYRLVDADGAVTSRVPARGPRSWRVELDGTAAQWRIAAVNADDPG